MKKYQMMTDEQLIRDLRSGDTAITDFILNKYKRLVKQRARAMFLLGGENDDLIQEGMIGLYKAIRDYNLDESASFYSFAEMCISRQMSTAIKSSRRQKHDPLNFYVPLFGVREEEEEVDEDIYPPLIDTMQIGKDNNPEELFLSKEYFEEISEKLQKHLSPLENKVLYLHLLGTDYQTIAKLLDKTPKSIDNALQRIKHKVNTILE